jgi:hypothetical protein
LPPEQFKILKVAEESERLAIKAFVRDRSTPHPLKPRSV